MGDNLLMVDTNVLLTASTPSRPLHEQTLRVLNDWPNQGFRLCASPQILREYLVVATRPASVNGLGLALKDGLSNVQAISRRMLLLSETQAVFENLRKILAGVECRGKQIHDANVVATALVHGVGKLVTENSSDFERFRSFIEVIGVGEG